MKRLSLPLGLVLCTAPILVQRGTTAEPAPVRMLVPGFTVRELPITLGNQNNLRFAPDGTLTSLGYDGRVWLLRDTDGDGRADEELVVARDWPAKDTASGNVDATAVTLDARGRIHFGLLVQNYANAYRLKRRAELEPAEIDWLKSAGRWRDAGTDDIRDGSFKSPMTVPPLRNRSPSGPRTRPRSGSVSTARSRHRPFPTSGLNSASI